MISAFANSLKIPELRQRIFFTLAMIVIVRLGMAVPLPGIDRAVLEGWLNQLADPTNETSRGAATIAALLNVFSGGGLQRCAVFALGIMPYISASIMMQLLSAVVPQLSKLSREDGGRQKIGQYTRFIAIALAGFQGYMLIRSLKNPENTFFLQGIAKTGDVLIPNYNLGFVVTAVLTIIAGTMFLMWLGEQITERGIGNGISLIITINIIAGLPGALVQVWRTYIDTGKDEQALNSAILLMLVAFFIAVIAAVIIITQGQRRIAIQYAKRVVGNKMYGGQTQYLPLKINYAGVMPIIFAQAIMLFPSQFLKLMFPTSRWPNELMYWTSPSHWFYYLFSAITIFFFSYFWVATMFQPTQISEDLKRNGGYVPGVRPGKPTADFLDFTMGRLTFAGAIFLTVIAVLPGIITTQFKVPGLAAQFFGGTSLLILVGVMLDVMRQVETHLLQRHYDGFLRKGKIRGRYDRNRSSSGSPSNFSGKMIWIYVILGLLVILGISYSLIRTL